MKEEAGRNTYFRRLRAGLYRRYHGGVMFDVEYDPEYRVWRCYADDVQFDAGRTLAAFPRTE